VLALVDEMRRLYDQMGLELASWEPGAPERVALLSAQADLIAAISASEAAEGLCKIIEVELEETPSPSDPVFGWWQDGPEGSN
jgi:hypothetical protein